MLLSCDFGWKTDHGVLAHKYNRDHRRYCLYCILDSHLLL